MPLPTDPLATWPPPSPARDKYVEWSAWYSGDPSRLIEAYAGGASSPAPDASVVTRVPWWRFWTRQRTATNFQGRASLHVPLAGDLAAVNAEILFSEEARITIPAAHEGATPDSSAVATEARLKVLLESSDVHARLTEAAETCAAMGGVFIYPAWDKGLSNAPFLQVAQVDQAAPEFRFGYLTSVIFFRDVLQDGNFTLRHLELHEVIAGKATIIHALYRAAPGVVGDRIALTSSATTALLPPTVVLPFEDLDVHYIPNRRPNRLWRNSPLGMSDYSGSEGIFDALDETYASWMRDIRLSKARLVVPTEYLDSRNEFDVDNEVFSPLNMEPNATQQGVKSMEFVQAEIRVEQFLKTTVEFTERVVSNAGYSPQTFGLRIEGRAESGTALKIRENKTFLTQRRKGHFWRRAVSRCLEQLLLIDKEQFDTQGIDPTFTIDTELADGVINDPVELANTANILKQAMAASTDVRVRMIHPEWTEEQIKTEVASILKEEKPATPPVVSTGPPQPQGGPVNG